MQYDIKRLSSSHKRSLQRWAQFSHPTSYAREAQLKLIRELMERDIIAALPEVVRDMASSGYAEYLVARVPHVNVSDLFTESELATMAPSGRQDRFVLSHSVCGFSSSSNQPGELYSAVDGAVSRKVASMVSQEFRDAVLEYLHLCSEASRETSNFNSLVDDCQSLRALLVRAGPMYEERIHFWAEARYRTGMNPSVEATNARFAP